MSRRRDFLALTVGAMAARGVSATAAQGVGGSLEFNASLPDAVLLRLGTEFDAVHALERAAWDAMTDDDTVNDRHPSFVAMRAAADRTEVIVTRILAVPAATAAGVLVKTRALAWCRSGEEAGVEMFAIYPWSNREPCEDEKMVVSILADLYQMAGVEVVK